MYSIKYCNLCVSTDKSHVLPPWNQRMVKAQNNMFEFSGCNYYNILLHYHSVQKRYSSFETTK